MPLPTTNLTLHCRADRTNQLFTTWVADGNHTGTPGDGDVVQVWDDEGDGIADVCLSFPANPPAFRSATPLMKNSCVDYDGTNDYFAIYDQTAAAQKALSTVITNNAFTVAVAIYPETIASTAANVYDNEALLAGASALWGIFFKDESGTKKVYGYNWDGDADVIGATINTGATWIVIFTHVGGQLQLTVIDEAGSETSPSDVPSGNTTALTGSVYVGANWQHTVFSGVRIGEFAIYNAAVTGADLADLKQYFKDQWLSLATAALTGTALAGITEADLVAGGNTVIVTVTGDTFIPA